MKSRYQRLFLIMFVIALLVAAGGCGKKADADTTENPITVDMAVASTAGIGAGANYSGRVKSDNEVSIMPKHSSRVTAVYVQAGEQVTAGQVLMSLDKTDLAVSIKQAEASLASAQAGQKTNEINLKAAQRNYERMQQLHDAGAVSDQEFEAARDQYESLNAGGVQASVAQAQAALLGLEKQIDDCEIISPTGGVVGRLDISVGDTANPQSPVAVINNGEKLEIELKVSENDISFINVGSEVQVRIEAVAEEALKGTIKSVASIADPLSHSYPVMATLSGTDLPIRSGMFAEVMVPTVYKQDVVVVPLIAVLPEAGNSAVYVIAEDNRAHKIMVETGINDGDNIEITKGLQAGQKVVTRGNTLIGEDSLLKLAGGGEK